MMTTANFPQADRLEQVGKVAIAVAKGNRAEEEIEAFIGLVRPADTGVTTDWLRRFWGLS